MYSSWIFLSDSISLLVLRFLLNEHVSLKLETRGNTARLISQRYLYNVCVCGFLCACLPPFHMHARCLLAAEEEEVQPDPGQQQHDDRDGETEDEPGPEVDHLRIRVATARGWRERESLVMGGDTESMVNVKPNAPHNL